MDSTHCADLGAFQDAISGVMFAEMAHTPWHRSYAVGVDWLNGQLKNYYGVNFQLSKLHLTVSMIKPGDGGPPS